MDSQGWFTFGPNSSHMTALCEKTEYIFVEVNHNMPRCLGGAENGIHISQISGVVYGTCPELGRLGSAAPTEVDQAVAKLIVEQIPNDATLQLGIGGMPNAVGSMIAQSDLKDLGVHIEMYVDAFVDIAMGGKITGSKKSLNRGMQVYAFGAGSQKLYDYLDDDVSCMAAPVDYTNDVRVVAQMDNFISINNAVDVELFGQVNAESAGAKYISGSGGQMDFVMGAYLSNDSIVTETRANIHYLVTEYGIVN